MKTLNALLSALVLAAAGHGALADEGFVEQNGPLLGQTTTDCTASPFPGDGPRPVIEGGRATLLRTPEGITALVTMPTPMSGTYCYPPATLALNPAAGPAVPGHPEAFSLWAIYFNNPGACLNGACSVADVLGPNCANALGGAVKLGGHVVGGSELHLSGHLSVGHGPLSPFGCSPFVNVEGAAIHLAVAPHGLMNPALMPAQIQEPPGGGPGYWYPAVFDPVD
jgi:hypothetical protein